MRGDGLGSAKLSNGVALLDWQDLTVIEATKPGLFVGAAFSSGEPSLAAQNSSFWRLTP